MARKNLDLADIGLVYSTDKGRLCPVCEHPVDECICKQQGTAVETDGIVRVQWEKKGRGGKTVTLIRGLPLTGNQLKGYLKQLQKQCGSGGSIKNNVIELQGDRVEHVMRILAADGYPVKRSGG